MIDIIELYLYDINSSQFRRIDLYPKGIIIIIQSITILLSLYIYLLKSIRPQILWTIILFTVILKYFPPSPTY